MSEQELQNLSARLALIENQYLSKTVFHLKGENSTYYAYCGELLGERHRLSNEWAEDSRADEIRCAECAFLSVQDQVIDLKEFQRTEESRKRAEQCKPFHCDVCSCANPTHHEFGCHGDG